jgi:large subunit ribosomal protein L4
MSQAIVLNNESKEESKVDLPSRYDDINSHNLYLYVKSYQAAVRANTSIAKTRSDVRGGGKKPWNQKGGGRARAGSTRSPIWVGGGKAFGPTFRNYDLKVNKKQKKLAFEFALNEKAANGKLFVVPKVEIKGGKTKNATIFLSNMKAKDVLIVTEQTTLETFLAFRNLKNAYLVDGQEVNAFLLTAFDAVVIEKNLFENMIKED